MKDIDKKTISVYVKVALEEMIQTETYTQEMFDKLVTNRLELELIDLFGEDFREYADTKVLKITPIVSQDALETLLKIELDIITKPEGVSVLLQTLDRLRIGL